MRTTPISSFPADAGCARRRARLRPGDVRGFTLLEILIVVVIIAMSAALVGPSLEAGFRAREVRSAARTLAGTLRTLQGDAVRSGKMQALVLDPARNVFTVGDERSFELGEVVRVGQISGGEYQPNGSVRVQFYPNGSTTGIALSVSDREASADGSYVVRLDPLIGTVTVRDAGR